MATTLELAPPCFKHGDHLCRIYETEAEQVAALVPFFREGLALRERCVYIADDRARVEFVAALEAVDVDVAQACGDGALQCLPPQTYLADGVFEPAHMIEFLHRAEAQARADGFAGLRAAGDMTWALDAHADLRRLVEYEAQVTAAFANTRTTFLCQYQRRLFPAGLIDDMLRTHPQVLFDTQVLQNPFYVPRAVGDDETSDGLRLDSKIAQLQELADSRLSTHAVFDNALDPMMLFTSELRYVDANPASCRLLGYSRAELLQRTAYDLTLPEERAHLPALLCKFLADGALSGDYRLLCKNGGVREVEFHAVARIHRDVHLAVYRDITQRKLAQEKLKTNAVLLAEAQRIAHVGSWNWDLITGLVQWSDEHYRIFGLRPQEADMTYERIMALVHPDDRATVEGVVQRALMDGQPYEVRLRTRHRDGTVRLLQSRGRVSLDENHEPTRVYGIVLDITDRQRAEDALREYAEKLQVLSHRVVEIQEDERRHLAHELHDEIGQVLSAVAVNLQAARGVCDCAARLDESLQLVEHATQQVRNLSLDLRPSMLDDLGLVSTLRWYADRQAQRAGFVLHFSAESYGERLPANLEIACYRVAQEALNNVVKHGHAREVWLDFQARAEEIQLAVRDDGVGFDLAATLTRAARGGSFGIRGMRERMELLHGQFEIQSAPSRGTSIRVFLPIPST